MTQEEIAKMISDQLETIIQDVATKGKKPEAEETIVVKKEEPEAVPDTTTVVEKSEPVNLDTLAEALAPKIIEKMNLNPETPEAEKSKVSKALKDTLKNLGFSEDDVDVDLVVKKKRKGNVTEEDETEDVIFTSKSKDEESETEDETEERVAVADFNAHKTALDGELEQLNPVEKRKALGIWIRGALLNK